MKKIFAFVLAFALIASLCSALCACVGDEEETGHKIIVGDGESGDPNETAKKPDGEGETTNWELGDVPLS